MMKKWVKIALGVVAFFLIIQIPIFTPAKNESKEDPVNDIANAYDVPMDIQMHIYNSCSDCHSNYTKKYPWYFHIQQVSWWMALHIRNAKQELNFSEFASYSPQRAAKKFKEIQQQMEQKRMPLHSYLWMHDEAKMTDQDYKDMVEWSKNMQAVVQAKIDSAKGN